jgi:23S rRNA maturation mini-RNase III
VANETSETTPTDEDWNREIARFRLYRDLEAEAKIMSRAVQLPILLQEEAAPIYDAANTLDRTLATNADLTTYQASKIRERIEAKGYDGDVFWDHVWEELRHHLLERVTCSPSALRQRANALADAADDAKFIIDYYNHGLKEIRISSGKGDYPSVAWYSLITAANRWNVPNSEIAQRLMDAKVPSDSASETIDVREQWMRIIRKARPKVTALEGVTAD